MYLATVFVAILATIAVIPSIDTLIGMLIWRPYPADVIAHGHEGRYISIVFPGFSNPYRELGEMMRRLLGKHGPVLVVRYDSDTTEELIFRAIMRELRKLKVGDGVVLYGHSMGGTIAEHFRLWYEKESNYRELYGEILALLLDCSPAGPRTLKTPIPQKLVRRLLTIWRNGVILTLLAVIGNLISRVTMRTQLDDQADVELYHRYARRLMWFHRGAWTDELRYMLDWSWNGEVTKSRLLVYYIGAENLDADVLVDQHAARLVWRQIHPDMQLITDGHIGHAWPMEQPKTYGRIFDGIFADLAKA